MLDERVWKRVRSLARGRSLSYIGKQSHHYLDARQLLRLLDLATRHVDFFMLEVQEPSLMADLEREEDLSRPEMEAAGFRALLVDDPGTRPNPLSHALSFSLQVRDRHGSRSLFSYSNWTSWQPVTLCALAGILGLRVLYFEPEAGEFRPVEAAGEDAADRGHQLPRLHATSKSEVKSAPAGRRFRRDRRGFEGRLARDLMRAGARGKIDRHPLRSSEPVLAFLLFVSKTARGDAGLRVSGPVPGPLRPGGAASGPPRESREASTGA